MRALLVIAAASGLAMAASPAVAENHQAKTPEVVETNAKGQATKVRIDGKVYDVCMKDDQDGCINPRAAGLKWGNRPLSYWPGKPASEIDGPLPADEPGS